MEVVAVAALVAAVLLAVAVVVQALANRAHANNNQALSDELDEAHEALEIGARVASRVAGGESISSAIVAEQASTEAQDLWRRFKTFAHLASILLVLALVGCGAVITHDEALSLQKGILDERKAVTVRPGFEDAVAAERSGTDAKLAALLQATSK